MKKILILGMALLFGFVVYMGATPAETHAKTTFITIGTGGITGVYYPTGGAIARTVNKNIYNLKGVIPHTLNRDYTNALIFDVNITVINDRRVHRIIGKNVNLWVRWSWRFGWLLNYA